MDVKSTINQTYVDEASLRAGSSTGQDVAQDSRVVVVGAGCFGLSTAYHLFLRGYTDITVLDRSTVLPAPDASSNDINRIVRSSYSDKFYTGLAREAIDAWRDRKFWGDTYHESGVLVLGFDNATEGKPEPPEGGGMKYGGDGVTTAYGSSSYADDSFANDLELGCVLVPLPDPASVRSVFPAGVHTGSFEGDDRGHHRRIGYLNRDGGWADAGQGVKILLSKVKRFGAKVHTGKFVSKIRQENGRVAGVSCADGTAYDADLVIVATGSWTPSTFPDLSLEGRCLSTGHCVAMIQLTEEEAERYRDCPVVLDFLSGFYCFPPTNKNILKLAIHGPGYTHTADSTISTPRTILSHPDTGLAIPKESVKQLRKGLCEVFPDLAEKPFCGTRLCWYNDTPDGDWIIGRYPSVDNLVLATAGSGHAYKFLPVIGRLVVDLIEDKLEVSLVKKFAVNRVHGRVDGSRSGPPTELDLNQLCSSTDLGSPSQV